MPPDEARRLALRRAVELLKQPVAHATLGGGWFWHFQSDYANGLDAYDAWVSDLADEDGIRQLPPPQAVMYWQGNAVLYNQLHDARYAAARYLRRIADDLPAGAAEHARRAADAYQAMANHLAGEWRRFPIRRDGYRHSNGWHITGEQQELEGRRVPAVADTWLPEDRKHGMDVLKRAKQLDEAALTALERLLPAM
jgi:hypothetical protein